MSIEKFRIGGKIIGTDSDKVEYNKNNAATVEDALDALFNGAGGGSTPPPSGDIISAGGSWMSLGTSITAPGTYQQKVMNRIQFTQHINKGTSGHFMGGGNAAFSDGGHADTVINVSADFFTIEYGINDWGFNIALGSMNDFTRESSSGINTSSFYYGYRNMIDRIYTVNPNAVIILCTPRKGYKANTWSNFNPEHWWDANPSGTYLKQYADAVIEIAK